MTGESLTNEALRGICKSNFELAHYAIALGRYYIKAGREVSIKEILKQVRKHPDPLYIEELEAIDAESDRHDAENQ